MNGPGLHTRPEPRWVLVLLAIGAIACRSTALAQAPSASPPVASKSGATVGAYYFDGWSGRSRWADDPDQPWARNAPTHLTRRMVEEFPAREPVWGWRNDSLATMERQIDLAADHGLAFFAFCWYWHDNRKPINPDAIRQDPKHTSLELFLKASNRARMKFCLLLANHGGFEIHGADHWRQAGGFLQPYLQHPQHLRVGGRPLVIVFDPGGAGKTELAAFREGACASGRGNGGRTPPFEDVAIAGCGLPDPTAGYTQCTRYNIVPGYAAGSEEHPYAALVSAHRAAWRGGREQPCIPTLTAGWDKRPWEGPAGLNQAAGWFFPDRTPEQFAGFLSEAIAWMDQHPEQTTAERLLLIYAWNEFGEGGYIAPTKGDPEARYLKALRSVVGSAGQGSRPAAPNGPAMPRR